MPEPRRTAIPRALAALGAVSLTAALSAAGVLADSAPAHAATTVSSSGELQTAVLNGEDEIYLDVPSDESWGLPLPLVLTSDIRIERAPSSAGRVTLSLNGLGGAVIMVSNGASFTGVGFDVQGNLLGPAIDAVLDSSVTLRDMTITGGTTGLAQAGGTLTATDVTFTGSGAGPELQGMDAVGFTRVTVTANQRGAAIQTAGGVVKITESDFTTNGNLFALFGGLSIAATNGATVGIEGGEFRQNQATNGGGIFIEELNDASLTLRGVDIVGNTVVGYGGGIGASQALQSPYSIDGGAELRIERTLISGNAATAIGGGIAIPAIQGGATVTIVESAISGNTAFQGAGIVAQYLHDGSDPALVVDSSTISGNIAQGTIGGAWIECDGTPGAGSALIVNSTFSGNSAGALASAIGAGCDVDDAMTVQIDHSTITEGAGAAGAAVAIFGIRGEIRNTAIGGNGNALDLDTADASDLAIAHSLVQHPDPAAQTALTAGAGNLPNAAPDLGPLAANGGPTQTHLPAAGGNLVDAGDPLFAPPPATDQRGAPRVVGVLDIGAVERGTLATPGGPSLPPTGSDPAVPVGIAMLTVAAGLGLMLARRTRNHISTDA